MKKNVLFMATAIILGSFFSSCKSDKKSASENITLNPIESKVKGDLRNYFEVVEKEYVTQDNSFGQLLTIEVKRLNRDLPFDPKSESVAPMGYSGGSITTLVGFGIELIDENGNVVDKKSATDGGMGGVYSSDDIKELYSLIPDETGTIRFSIGEDVLEKKPVKFRLTSALEKVSPSEIESTSVSSDDDDEITEEDDELTSSVSSTDVDEALEAYERYCNKYIAAMKKSASGDLSALADYAELLQEAQEYEKKIESIKGELTPSQLKKFAQIQTNLLNALQE